MALHKEIIILATNNVNDETLFLNGLTQNIVILYNLFESLGYQPMLLQNPDANAQKKSFIHGYKVINAQDIIRKTLKIKLFIEIGMSIDESLRNYLELIGSKNVRLYLCNILNIDIETVQNYNNLFFNHHVIAKLEEVWTSPHYEQHVDYTAAINRTSLDKTRIVPYIWDPCLISHYGPLEWMPITSWQNTNIVIMDPNISFQKCSFYSLILVEAFAKKYPEWRGKVHVVNGDRLKFSANAFNKFLPSLSIFEQNRIVLHPRKKIFTIFEEYPSSCFITHQWNNEFNYMMLELLHYNYPILHNSPSWSDAGYYYSVNEWDKAIDTLKTALTTHKDNIQLYKTAAKNLMWRHSIYNPEVQTKWREIVEAP